MIQAITSASPFRTAAGQRPTVCHVIHALGVGGAEVLVGQMVRRMADEFRCVVAVLDDIGELGRQLQQDGVTVEHLQRQPGIDRRCAARLRAFADREQAGLLHAHQCTPFFQAMLSRGLTGRRPVVLTEHGRHFPDQPSRKRMLVNRLLLRRQDRLIGCGEAVRQALIHNEGLPGDRVEVIYNGVDLTALAQPAPAARARVRAEFGYADTDLVMILVARLHALKDHQTALRTVDRVRAELPGARLLLVGDGDQRAAVQQAVSERGLAAHVTLAGTRRDIPDLLAAADVFLMTSISEGIPLTLIEAMAARVPVVATAVGGIPEMLQDGVSGLLAAAGDDAGLAQAVLRMGREPGLARRLTQVAAAAAVQQFSLEAMLNSYRQVYRGVLQEVER